jgi:SAM-dependent MidA family methyltransferase
MTALRQRLKDLIAATGPMSVADYMAMCLFDPADGYYTTREPFGASGDFTTAPEISQMFGELVGVWLKLAWDRIGSPLPFTLAEIGPGRGTLTSDILRTLRRIDPAMAAGAVVALIEISPRLRDVQRETLSRVGVNPQFHDGVDTLPAKPTLIVGNEIFDAIPFRQFVHTETGWRERVVGLDESGALCFFAGTASLDPALLPPDAEGAPAGTIVEIAPARAALMDVIAEHLSAHSGCGLFIDYGYLEPATGDSFQALRRHQSEDVLAHPGKADLTSHVDFAVLANAARCAGLQTDLTTQGDFLLGLGLLERAGRLGAQASPEGRTAISQAVARLAGPDQMGNLFKVLSITVSADWRNERAALKRP